MEPMEESDEAITLVKEYWSVYYDECLKKGLKPSYKDLLVWVQERYDVNTTA